MLTDNIVAYWKFDEGTGSTVGDSAGSNTGTWNGTLGSQWASGIINSAGNFNGTDNYVNTSYAPSLTTNSDISVSLWVKINGNPSAQVILFGSKGGSGNGTSELALYLNDSANTGKLSSYYIGSSGTQNYIANAQSTSPNLRDGNWHHIVYTYSHGAGVGTQYVDNVARGTVTAKLNNNPTFTGNPFYIGAENVSGSLHDPIPAVIDEVGVWNRALSASEVAQLYNNGMGLQYPFTGSPVNPTASGTLFKTIQSMQVNFIVGNEGVVSNINARAIKLRSTQDCYVDFNQPVAPSTSYLISGSNTVDTEIYVPNGTINNLYFQGATAAGVLYITAIY